MQAIMLAAGKGSRLGKYTKDNTKCMLEVNDITLLERTINALKIANVNKLILVLGYKMENVKKYVEKNIKDMEIIYVDNYDYDKTNNIYSLYMAKDYLAQDDTILLESDLIYDESIIKKLIESPYESAAVVAKYEQWMDGTVVVTDRNDSILNFIEKKDFRYDDIEKYYKTVNIYKFSKEFSNKYYLPFLEAYMSSHGKSDYYELVLKVIVGFENCGLKAFKLTDEHWYEIDDCQDLDIASTLFANDNNRLDKYQKRYGGYWRFNKLRDFCYLVNPYFPTEPMKDKMRYFFDKLLVEYPSGLTTQNICASRMFENIDEKFLIVGNGAAELINNLKNVISGKIAVCVPTFNEYIRCLPDVEIVEIKTSETNYTFDTNILIKTLTKTDGLVIVNPDNPSGSFIKYEEMMKIVNHANKLNKWLIVDESFIDFAPSDLKYTLCDDDIISANPKLIVIKSISKSYGVPGLRLGVLASSNREVLQTIKDNLPVWNINSFAEYFLQIINLYNKDYVRACEKISVERERFYRELLKNKNIKVFKSYSNYFLCEVINGDANELANNLLKKYNVLIKVLNGKKGFENGHYIRIAIRDEIDNNYILNCLKDNIWDKSEL